MGVCCLYSSTSGSKWMGVAVMSGRGGVGVGGEGEEEEVVVMVVLKGRHVVVIFP